MSICMSSDPYIDWLRHEAAADREKDEWLRSRPICDDCGEPIEDEYAVVFGGTDYYCEDCIEKHRKRIG